MPRAQAEADLIDALHQDLIDLHEDMIDLKLRKKIDHLMAKVMAES